MGVTPSKGGQVKVKGGQVNYGSEVTPGNSKGGMGSEVTQVMGTSKGGQMNYAVR